jgi:putative transposase
MNHKKLYRLYREEGLSVRRRGRKRARGSRTPMPVPLRPNDRWSMDFVADTFGASRRLRILAINDDACRENLCLLGDTSISGARVARELDALVRLYGKPACIVSDNGTEFTSRTILKWASENRVEWHYIDPGKPQQNAFIEPKAGEANRSTGRCTMNCSTRSCSTASPMPGASLRCGATTTTTSDRTHPWGTERRHKRAGRSCKMEASHPARLCRRASTDIKPADSRYDRGTNGGQVTLC